MSYFFVTATLFESLQGFALVSAYIFASIFMIIPVISYFLTPSFDYNNKHVIVTGGSSGIGLECAKIYAKRGANVTIVARDQVKLQAALKELEEHKQDGRNVTSVSVDTASSQKAVSEAFEFCIDLNGEVDVLLNCAGTSIAGEFDLLDPTDFERMMKVNLLGSVYPTRAVLKGMKENGQGRIIFVASQAAQAAIHGFTAYGASKWALRGLAEALQMEVKPYKILVSVAYPPDTDTPGYKEEMLTKPYMTKKLSESGTVTSPVEVANDIVNYSAKGYYGITTGLDGWLLKQMHSGMTPVNNLWEVTQGILFAPLCRFISLFYIIAWDMEVSKEFKKNKSETVTPSKGGGKKGQAPEREGIVTRGSAKKSKSL